MNYEIAKKLKDAGFEMRERFSYHKNPLDPFDGQGYFFPSLSELIKACGEGFGALLHTPQSKFQAMGGGIIASDKEGQGTWNIQKLGDTPEEAVANLWLQLHDQNRA